MRTLSLTLSLTLLFACGAPVTAPPDAGADHDAGTSFDAGATDAGQPDAGTADAGTCKAPGVSCGAGAECCSGHCHVTCH